MSLKFALVGNPNCGKTTLFNELTGSNAYVGNWPGVTIERKEGKYKKPGQDIDIIDLPGIYSLSPYTPEEIIARNYIMDEAPDAIINIVDATNPERNLYLTTQILETDYPLVIALNMIDQVEKSGDTVDVEALAEEMGAPVVPISALKAKGTHKLMETAIAAAQKKREAKNIVAHPALSPSIAAIREVVLKTKTAHPLFYAVKLLESDPIVMGKQSFAPFIGQIKELQEQAAKAYGSYDFEAIIAGIRYDYISANCTPLIKNHQESGALSTSDKIDRVLTHKIFGIPIFLLAMLLVFHLTFANSLFGIEDIPGPGVFLQGLVESLIGWIAAGLTYALQAGGASPWLFALVIDGIVGGVGAVASFIPQIGIMFLFLSIMEDSGYMARGAFIMDRALRKFGLSGKSFIPMIMGFGCGVTGILATRTLECEKDRRITAMLIPFMSCGAKAPIYALFAGVLFADHAGLMTFSIYLIGILAAVTSGIILKNTVFRGKVSPFVMELPTYHFPQLKTLLKHVWEKLKGFVVRAGTILVLATIVIWFLSSFGATASGFGMVDGNSQKSILGVIGSAIQPFFVPLGFGAGDHGWKAIIAILTGLVAKEMVVSTMGVLYSPGFGGNDYANDMTGTVLASHVAAIFSPAAALSFMAFNLLTIPCLASVAVMRSEMNSHKWSAFIIAFWILVSWVVSFLIYQVGTMMGF